MVKPCKTTCWSKSSANITGSHPLAIVGHRDMPSLWLDHCFAGHQDTVQLLLQIHLALQLHQDYQNVSENHRFGMAGRKFKPSDLTPWNSWISWCCSQYALIVGFPHQTTSCWKRSIKDIKVAGVTPIAIFSKWGFLKMVGSITSRWLLTYTK